MCCTQVMSLVLSYLPDPFLRTRMLVQARKCLRPRPHRASPSASPSASGADGDASSGDADAAGGLLLVVDRWSVARDPPSELAARRQVHLPSSSSFAASFVASFAFFFLLLLSRRLFPLSSLHLLLLFVYSLLRFSKKQSRVLWVSERITRLFLFSCVSPRWL